MSFAQTSPSLILSLRTTLYYTARQYQMNMPGMPLPLVFWALVPPPHSISCKKLKQWGCFWSSPCLTKTGSPIETFGVTKLFCMLLTCPFTLRALNQNGAASLNRETEIGIYAKWFHCSKQKNQKTLQRLCDVNVCRIAMGEQQAESLSVKDPARCCQKFYLLLRTQSQSFWKSGARKKSAKRSNPCNNRKARLQKFHSGRCWPSVTRRSQFDNSKGFQRAKHRRFSLFTARQATEEYSRGPVSTFAIAPVGKCSSVNCNE